MREHEFSGALPDGLKLVLGDPASSIMYLHALIEHSPIAIVVLDERHCYRMCNPAFAGLFQYTREELAASDLDALIAAPDHLCEATDLSRRVLGGVKVHTVTQRRRKDGMIVDVEVYGVPLVVEDRVEGVYGLYQDVTDRNTARSALQQISSRFEQAQEEERRRFARDLHDSTSQELAVLNWNLTRLERMVRDGDEALRDLVRQTREMAQQCSARIRSTSYLLHPPQLREAGLGSAVRWLAEGFEQRSGIRVTVEIAPDLARFPEDTEGALFRIVQEGLANVLRHSGSSRVRVSLEHRSQWLSLRVADEGSSPGGGAAVQAGVGINGMRERVEELGGFFRIERNGSGTAVLADVPAGQSCGSPARQVMREAGGTAQVQRYG